MTSSPHPEAACGISQSFTEPAWINDRDEPFLQRRERLPEPAEEPPRIGFRNFVGVDRSKFADLSLPVALCEPVTDMQRRGDFLEYVELLHEAARLPCGSLERLLKVTAFTVSIYSCVYRPFVPFKSPAGETSEAVAPDRGIRAIAEKCADKPGVNAYHVEGRGWVLSGDELNVVEFRGQHCNIRPTGLIRVDFHDGETFSWNPLVTTIQHLIVGSAYIDHYGTLHVRSTRSDLSAKVKFKEPLVGSPNHKVGGHVMKGEIKQSFPKLHGAWNSRFLVTAEDGSEQLLWQKNPPHQYPSRYNLTRWAVSLNTMSPGLERLLPPSDMRWRKDVRALEEGRYEQAEQERSRILTRLKMARGTRTEPHKPRWFTFQPEEEFGKGRRYVYKGGYFETRETVKIGMAEWTGCPDLFGDGPAAAVYP